VTYTDGIKQKTAGLLKGDLRWNQVKVETPHGECRNGVLHFNRNAIRPDNYRMRLLVTLAAQPGKQHETYLQLPFLTAIRFHHYADSLKRGIHFYLNVEGIYNSGRIYPLDTSRVRLYADKGKIIGQDLLIPQHDSLTRSISVKAVYRGNAAIIAASVVPVKQLPDDGSLIIQDVRDVYKKRPGKRRKD
jgi:hypothetical protein